MLGSQVHPRRPPGALGRQRPVAARCPLPPPRTQAWPGWRWGWRQCPGLDSGTASSLPRRGNQGTAQRGARGYWSVAALPSPALVTARPPPWLVLARATDTLTAEPGSARSLCPGADAWDSKCGGGGAWARPTETAGAEGRWGGDAGPGLRQATLGAGVCHGQPWPWPLGHHGQQRWGHVALLPPGRRAEHSSDTGVDHGLYSPHSSESHSRGAGTRASLRTHKRRLFPGPRSQGLLGPQGDRAGAVTAVQGARGARRGAVGGELGWAKLAATTAQPRDPQPQPLQGTLGLRGERALSPGVGALGGAHCGS